MAPVSRLRPSQSRGGSPFHRQATSTAAATGEGGAGVGPALARLLLKAAVRERQGAWAEWSRATLEGELEALEAEHAARAHELKALRQAIAKKRQHEPPPRSPARGGVTVYPTKAQLEAQWKQNEAALERMKKGAKASVDDGDDAAAVANT